MIYQVTIASSAPISQGERKTTQMEDTHDNLSKLMQYFLFYA